jgi:hypothetical protein
LLVLLCAPLAGDEDRLTTDVVALLGGSKARLLIDEQRALPLQDAVHVRLLVGTVIAGQWLPAGWTGPVTPATASDLTKRGTATRAGRGEATWPVPRVPPPLPEGVLLSQFAGGLLGTLSCPRPPVSPAEHTSAQWRATWPVDPPMDSRALLRRQLEFGRLETYHVKRYEFGILAELFELLRHGRLSADALCPDDPDRRRRQILPAWWADPGMICDLGGNELRPQDGNGRLTTFRDVRIFPCTAPKATAPAPPANDQEMASRTALVITPRPGTTAEEHACIKWLVEHASSQPSWRKADWQVALRPRFRGVTATGFHERVWPRAVERNPSLRKLGRPPKP